MINIVIITLSLFCLFYSLVSYIRLSRLEFTTMLRGWLQVFIVMISVFIIGYFVYLSTLITHQPIANQNIVITSIFFLGSIFVILTTKAVASSLGVIKSDQEFKTQELLKIKAKLEAESSEKTAQVTASKHKLEQQQMALINVLEDISQDKQYNESQSKSMLEIIGEGIVVTDDKGVITYINPTFEKMLGFSFGDLKGKVMAEAIKAIDLKDKVIPISQLSDAAMVTAFHQETKLLMARKDGGNIAFIVNARPIYVDKQYKGVIRVFHDFTDELNVTRQKDDFFSIASHELRTPLTVIGGNLDIILQGYGKSQLSQDDRELIIDATIASDRLIKMVNDFLNVSRLDQGRLKIVIEPIDLCALTESVVKELLPLAERQKLYLRFTCQKDQPQVLADIDKLKEVLINLIGNSLKFTKEGGITINHQLGPKFMEVTVTDTGFGIPKDKQGLLFQRFQQAMDRTLAREAGGTGLGLYISKEFVKKMGGEFRLVNSEPGVGTTFAFTLPLAKVT